jgi:hypothetical protein
MLNLLRGGKSMMRSKSTLRVVAAAWLLMVVPGRLHAQEFSASQKEIWKNVETYYVLEMEAGSGRLHELSP